MTFTRPAHTPGPWTYNQWSREAISPNVVVLEDDGACGDPECCGAPSYSIEIKAEDARLIAAAPELLEALIELVKQHKNVRAAEGYPTVNSAATDAADAAITKATGAA